MDTNIHTIQPQNPNLIEITTPIQARRGNRQFFCQKHKVSYITYANGYVRREVKASYVSPYTASQKVYKVKDQFVLNRRFCASTAWGYKAFKIIKEHCPQKRMDIIDRLSTNYKGYTGRYTQPGHTLIMK